MTEDELAALVKKMGPKIVQTPNMTVTTHDLDQVIKAQRATSQTPLPTICGLGGCVSKPKTEAYGRRKIDDCS